MEKVQTIEANCFLFDKKMAEMDIPTEDVPARIFMRVSEISHVRELTDDDNSEISKDTCVVYFKSGDSVIIDKSYDEVYKLILNAE